MLDASNRAEEKPVSYSRSEVELIDQVQAAASALSGVAEALQYRAAAEGDDMLSMLADVVCKQVDILCAAVQHGRQ